MSLQPELDSIFRSSQKAFEHLRGKRIFITGGTGFIGTWLLKSFIDANQRLSLNAEILVLSRNPNAFLQKHPEFKKLVSVNFIEGDLIHFEKALRAIKGKIDFVIHAATDVQSVETRESQATYDLNIAGTKKLLAFCSEQKIEKYLFTSSGAVYGEQPEAIEKFTEDYLEKNVEKPIKRTLYGEGKWAAEKLSIEAGRESGFEVKIARIFAVIGPLMPMNGTYAAGHFIQQVIQKQPIRIRGDGTPLRSFIYIADLVNDLWNLLVFGDSYTAYNVAGDEVVSILELAEIIKTQSATKDDIILESVPTGKVMRYVGSNEKLKQSLGLKHEWSFAQGIQKCLIQKI